MFRWAFHRWEEALHNRTTDRLVREFDWGLEWLRDLPHAPDAPAADNRSSPADTLQAYARWAVANTPGSSARKTAAATGTPQTTPGSSSRSSARQRASSGTSASVVASPEPTSSASAAADDARRCPPASVPLLQLRLAAGMDDEVPGERLALDGEVLAEVDAAALLPREPAGGDLADERVRRVEQAPESLGAADQPGVAPERGARIRRRERSARALRRRSGARRARRGRRGGRRRGTRAASSRRAGSRRARLCTRTRRPRTAPAPTCGRRGR